MDFDLGGVIVGVIAAIAAVIGSYFQFIAKPRREEHKSVEPSKVEQLARSTVDGNLPPWAERLYDDLEDLKKDIQSERRRSYQINAELTQCLIRCATYEQQLKHANDRLHKAELGKKAMQDKVAKLRTEISELTGGRRDGY